MESNIQLPTSYLYVETKQRLLEIKTSSNDCMLTILNYDKIFQGVDKSIKKSWPLKLRLKLGHNFLTMHFFFAPMIELGLWSMVDG